MRIGPPFLCSLCANATTAPEDNAIKYRECLVGSECQIPQLHACQWTIGAHWPNTKASRTNYRETLLHSPISKFPRNARSRQLLLLAGDFHGIATLPGLVRSAFANCKQANPVDVRRVRRPRPLAIGLTLGPAHEYFLLVAIMTSTVWNQ